MFENGSVWRPPNCTSYFGESGKEKEAVKEEVKEESKPQPETKPSSKPSRKGLLSDRCILFGKYFLKGEEGKSNPLVVLCETMCYTIYFKVKEFQFPGMYYLAFYFIHASSERP